MTAPSQTPDTPLVAAAPQRTLGIVSFALGLGSLAFGLIFLVPIAAIVLGVMALSREPSSKGFAITGIVIGAIQLGWLLVTGAIFLVAFPFFGLLGAWG